jgi:CelD/BcsL family acetyltransferase involved in cellulose biosynthesis
MIQPPSGDFMSDTITTHDAAEALALPGWPDGSVPKRAILAADGFAIERVQDIRAMPQWPGLMDRGSHALAFQRRDHLEIWLETIGRGLNVTPHFVSVSTRAGEPVMLLPLGIQRKHGLKVLTFLDGGVADYNAPILYPIAGQLTAADVSLLWKAIGRAVGPFDLARLEKMPEYVGGIKNPLHALARERWHISGHYLTLEDGTDVKRPNPKESRRKLRRLSEHGEVRFGIATEADEIARVFEAFRRQKSRRYMETLGHPGFDVPGQLSYYLTLTQRLPGRGVQLAYLQVGDEVVATAWNLIAGARLYYMMAGYEDGKWRRHSPSWLLLEELVNWSCRNGITIFDFGIGDESYKLKWQETELPLWSAALTNSLPGWFWLKAEASLLRLKRAMPRSVIEFLKAGRARLQGRPPIPLAAVQ